MCSANSIAYIHFWPPAARDSWIQIAEDRNFLGAPQWSQDGRLIYYASTRDDHPCIWAQPVTADGHPAGALVPVWHRHRSVESSTYFSAPYAVAPGTLYLSRPEVQGNVYMVKVH